MPFHPFPSAQLSCVAHALQLELLVHVAHISAGLLRGAAREGQDPRLEKISMVGSNLPSGYVKIAIENDHL